MLSELLDVSVLMKDVNQFVEEPLKISKVLILDVDKSSSTSGIFKWVSLLFAEMQNGAMQLYKGCVCFALSTALGLFQEIVSEGGA